LAWLTLVAHRISLHRLGLSWIALHWLTWLHLLARVLSVGISVLLLALGRRLVSIAFHLRWLLHI